MEKLFHIEIIFSNENNCTRASEKFKNEDIVSLRNKYKLYLIIFTKQNKKKIKEQLQLYINEKIKINISKKYSNINLYKF